MKSRWIGVSVFLALVVFALAPGARETRVVMREIFSHLRAVVPALAVDDVLEDSGRRANVRAALEAIAERADELDEHGTRFDPGRDAARRTLGIDARRAVERIDAGQLGAARFFATRLTESCIACHARLPSDDSPVSGEFFRADELRLLPLERQAELAIATRRYDDALEILETVLADEDRIPAALLDPVVDYLTVSIRVKGEFERPAAVLKRFAERPDLWTQLRADVRAWTEDLHRYAKEPQIEGDVASARDQMDRGRLRVRYPTDRRALVDYLVASRTLHRVVAASPTPTSELANAYYMLGIIESRIGRNHWITPAETYLETAIHIAPGTEIARAAYAMLEEELIVGYSGSGGTHLPPEERKRLDALSRIANGKPAASSEEEHDEP